MPWNGKFYIEMAQALERAKFDYMILEDKCHVSDVYGSSMAAELKHGVVPPAGVAHISFFVRFVTASYSALTIFSRKKPLTG